MLHINLTMTKTLQNIGAQTRSSSCLGEQAIPELVGGPAICNMGLLPVSPGQLPLVSSFPSLGRRKRPGTLTHPFGSHVSIRHTLCPLRSHESGPNRATLRPKGIWKTYLVGLPYAQLELYSHKRVEGASWGTVFLPSATNQLGVDKNACHQCVQ